MAEIQALPDHMASVAERMRRAAARSVFDGRVTVAARGYMIACTFDDHRTATRLIFTRDTGHHSSGWMRNPDFERCLHLSTSPIPTRLIVPGAVEHSAQVLEQWVRAFYGDDARYTWAESPKSDVGRARDVWHWRVFCDATWRPFLPRGEVYSSDLTEAGWMSASEVFERFGRIIESTVDPR